MLGVRYIASEDAIFGNFITKMSTRDYINANTDLDHLHLLAQSQVTLMRANGHNTFSCAVGAAGPRDPLPHDFRIIPVWGPSEVSFLVCTTCL